MLDIIAGIVVSILSLIGAAVLIRWAVLAIFRPTTVKTTIIVDTEGLSADEIEYTVRCLCARLKWTQRHKSSEFIIKDSGMDSESKEICRRLCKDYGFIKIIR